jgi:hypothetical protein
VSVSLNIVAFDVPYPPDYGGVIDVYWKLYWLKKQGVRIHLHCFTYGRPEAGELDALCEKVYYYRRRTGLLSNFSLLPYTVRSRTSGELRRNLLSNEHPILFEVLHTCYLMNDPRLSHRLKIYRHSNIEHEYYAALAGSERNFLKRWYLRLEALKLKRFEKVLRNADVILAVNQRDTAYFNGKFPSAKSIFLPSFHPYGEVQSQTGRSDYVLFHGNLAVSENYEAAGWLADHVFPALDCQVVVAGKRPPAFLREKLKKLSNVRLVDSPSGSEMERLVKEAQVHVLFTIQPTGLKLKLLYALFSGRFIVCNGNMLAGTGLSAGSTLFPEEDAEGMIGRIRSCLETDFSAELAEERRKLVIPFENGVNAQRLADLLKTVP